MIQTIVAGQNGAKYEYVIATRGNGYLFAYAYSGRPFKVKMGTISGSRVRGLVVRSARRQRPRDRRVR